MGYMCLFQFWFPQGICLGVGFLGHMVLLILVFQGIFIWSSIVAVSIYTLTNTATAFSFLHTLSSVYCLLTTWWWPFWQVWGNISLYFWFESIMSDVEDLMHNSNNEWCWASSPVLVSHWYVFFGEMSVRSFSHLLIGLFVFLVLSCMSCLYVLEINPLSVVSFAIIFCHPEGCLFTLLKFSLLCKSC